jgi:hypothetical protein
MFHQANHALHFQDHSVNAFLMITPLHWGPLVIEP